MVTRFCLSFTLIMNRIFSALDLYNVELFDNRRKYWMSSNCLNGMCSQIPDVVCSDMLRCHRASPGCNNNEVMWYNIPRRIPCLYLYSTDNVIIANRNALNMFGY